MADSDEEDGSLDGVILQVFEEQADKFTFPLTTQKQTRDFVRLLNRKGFDYEMIADAVGEKLNYFQSWRLGSDASSIGARVMKRINRPLQDAMLSDDDDTPKVVDKVKQLLFNGMSIDIDDADGALDIIDDKRRKKVMDRNKNSATEKQKIQEENENKTGEDLKTGTNKNAEDAGSLSSNKNEKSQASNLAVADPNTETKVDKVKPESSNSRNNLNVETEGQSLTTKSEKSTEISKKNSTGSDSPKITDLKKIEPEETVNKPTNVKAELNEKNALKPINENSSVSLKKKKVPTATLR